jgi:hypothetical protein
MAYDRENNRPGKEHYRRYPIPSLAMGINDSVNPARLNDGELSSAENVDFDRDSVKSSGGSIKFNNQQLPHSAVRTKVTYSALSTLGTSALPGSVPQRGRVDVPYDEKLDIGGDFAAYDAGVPAASPSHTFHTRRGKSFDVSISFQIPQDQPLFGRKTSAGVNPSSPSIFGGSLDNYDEALEDCTIILQKGGDGLAAMSWALGVVNTGAMFERITGASTASRVSDYALVFMWLDAPQWGGHDAGAMRYAVGSGSANVGTTGRYSTHAYRAIVANYFVETGKTYHVAVSLKLDTGSPFSGGTLSDPAAAWNQDGVFTIVAKDEDGASSILSTSSSGLYVWKGPQDSIEYLKRYGVRFSGRDMMHVGLGYRFTPWSGWGFVPFGPDSAPLEAGGFRMIDVGAQAQPSNYSTTWLASHTLGNAYLTINLQGMHGGQSEYCPHPLTPLEINVTGLPAVGTDNWPGLRSTMSGGYVPTQGTAGESHALRNYWIAMWGSSGSTDFRYGGRLLIRSYYESGASYRFDVDGGASVANFSNTSFCIVGFRWNQRELVVSNLRIFDASVRLRDWSSARALWALSSYSVPGDSSDPDSDILLASWPMDDGGGGVVIDSVGGRSAYLSPYMLGQKDGLYLSGEGEAVCLDMSENPAFMREMKESLRSGSTGFAIELVAKFPQAFYARMFASAYTSVGYIAEHSPVIASWEAKTDDQAEYKPRPIIRLSAGGAHQFTGASRENPFYFPQGFSCSVAASGDQYGQGILAAVPAWSSTTSSRWSLSGAWVGQKIRIQFGVQPNGTEDSYSVYIAASPKSVLNPADGDPSEAEFAYFATATISKKDLARSVIVIGGAWNPFDPQTDDQERHSLGSYRARMIVEEAIVYAAPAPGKLPATSGGVSASRDGKLTSQDRLPLRKLKAEDFKYPLSATSSGITAADASAVIYPSDASNFFTQQARDSSQSVAGTFVRVEGEDILLGMESTTPKKKENFHYVSSVSSGGASATFATPFTAKSQENAGAYSFRVVGYTAFSDYIGDKPLSLGSGSAYKPLTATVDDVVLTDEVWKNVAPISDGWRLAVVGGQTGAAGIVPTWWRSGCVPRKNPVLGLKSAGGRLFAATKGCLYEVDDRWRVDGPSTSLSSSLAVIGDESGGVSFPLQSDRVEFSSAAGCLLPSSSFVSKSYDAWIKIDAYRQYQTILWVGSKLTDPLKLAGSTTGTHSVNVWTRLASGYPEIAIGSSQLAAGGAPEKGLYVARGSSRVPLGAWTHVRFCVLQSSAGNISRDVRVFVNGRSCSVSINAVPAASVAPDWLLTSQVSGQSGSIACIGTARDAYVKGIAASAYVDDFAGGQILRPDVYRGWMHCLDGLVCQAACFSGPAMSSFDPYSISYTSPAFLAVAPADGVGHKVYDSGGGQYGVIHSHPGISLFHELGPSDMPASWAVYGKRLFVTTGGRPAYVQTP